MAESPPKSRAKSALAPGDEAPWHDLPAEILPRILARLPINEVPCTARLVCKAVAAALSSPAHTTVRLSQPSPHNEFARRWGAPGAMRPLTLKRRRRLLCLTASSGCLHNLTWLAEHAGCFPDASVLEAAAAAGRLEACRWLLQRGGEGLSAALSAAARAGQRSTLEALLADPGAQPLPIRVYCGQDFRAILASCAACGGHVGLMDWLLERFGPRLHDLVNPHGLANLFGAAAAGCDLPTLQRLHLGCASAVNVYPDFRHVYGGAASSPTPDWRAKVEWLEACLGAPLKAAACTKAAACPDALERLTWLRARGCPWDSEAVEAAAGAGNVQALSYLLAEGCAVDIHSAMWAAAAGGHLAALEALHSHGLAATNPEAWAAAALHAACGGHTAAVRWMLGRQLIVLQQPAARREHGTLMGGAAQSGSLELLALLLAGGCRWGEGDLYVAARGGSEAALEWAVAQGCPVQDSADKFDDPYFIAAQQGDRATMACLRRLAVPWRPLTRHGGTFTNAVQQGYGVPILRRLLELGCPVDWVRAAEVAKYHSRDDDVRTWLKQEVQQRTEQEGGLQRAVGEAQRRQ